MCLHQPTFALIRLLGSRRVDFLEPVGAGAPGELGVGGGGALVRGTGPGVRNRGARYESRGGKSESHCVHSEHKVRCISYVLYVYTYALVRGPKIPVTTAGVSHHSGLVPLSAREGQFGTHRLARRLVSRGCFGVAA